MDNTKILNEINKIKKDYLLEVKSYTTIGKLANNSGTIITTDKKVYNYSIFYNEKEINDENINSYIKEITTLNENEYNKLINFINEENILNKQFTEIEIEDSGFIISIKLNNQERVIKNCVSFDTKNPKIYDKILILLKETLGQ